MVPEPGPEYRYPKHNRVWVCGATVFPGWVAVVNVLLCSCEMDGGTQGVLTSSTLAPTLYKAFIHVEARRFVDRDLFSVLRDLL